MAEPRQSPVESPTAPPAIRLLLLAVLPVLAAVLYLDGQQYDPDLLEFRSSEDTIDAAAALLPDRLGSLDRFGQVRVYDRDRLYEYINGHAEFFIGAGFEGLTVAEYGKTSDGQPQLVINLYDLGAPLNAFGVLVTEAGGQESVDVGTLGFATAQGVSFIQGRYYVQMNQFDADKPPLDAAREAAKALAQVTDAADLVFRFPDFGTPVSTRYVHEYYRGVDVLHRVLERSFQRDDTEFPAFVVSVPEGDAAALGEQLRSFLAGDGIAYRQVEVNGVPYTVVEDPYEGSWFFVVLGNQLLGAFTELDDELADAVSAFTGTAGEARGK